MSDIFFRDEGIEHGSIAGYRQEYKLGLDRCEACKKAYSADRLRRKHEQKQREKEADKEFEDAEVADEEELLKQALRDAVSNSPLSRFSQHFIPNPIEYEEYGILPTQGSLDIEDDETAIPTFDIGPLLPELNAAQQAACVILIEKNPTLFAHLVFQQLTMVGDIDEELASAIADSPFLFGDDSE